MSAPHEWSDEAPHYPHRCPLSGKGTGEDRFYNTNFAHRSFDVMDDREHVLFLSEQAIRDAINAPGSSFADISPEELAELTTELEENRELLREATLELERLRKEKAPQYVVPDGLVEQVVDRALDRATA